MKRFLNKYQGGAAVRKTKTTIRITNTVQALQNSDKHSVWSGFTCSPVLGGTTLKIFWVLISENERSVHIKRLFDVSSPERHIKEIDKHFLPLC